MHVRFSQLCATSPAYGPAYEQADCGHVSVSMPHAYNHASCRLLFPRHRALNAILGYFHQFLIFDCAIAVVVKTDRSLL